MTQFADSSQYVDGISSAVLSFQSSEITIQLHRFGFNKKSVAFRLVALLNMVTMLVFRLAVSLFLCYWLVRFEFWLRMG